MKVGDFNKVVEFVFNKCREILVERQQVYGSGEDRLRHFKDMAAFLRETPEESAIGVAAKHTISIVDFVSSIQEGRKVSMDQWLEKIVDDINYRILLLALVWERYDEPALVEPTPVVEAFNG